MYYSMKVTGRSFCKVLLNFEVGEDAGVLPAPVPIMLIAPGLSLAMISHVMSDHFLFEVFSCMD